MGSGPPSDDNLLRNVKFVKLVAFHDLDVAEAVRKLLRRGGVGAVIINDERVQARPAEDRARAAAPQEGFRIEVPEPMAGRARAILGEFEQGEEA